MMTVESFISALKKYKSEENVFNPWRDYHRDYDIGKEAPAVRRKHLEAFLKSRLKTARYLLAAEAVGYQGARFTGVALTSERILLGHQREINPAVVLPEGLERRTSNAESCPFPHKTQKEYGFAEPTATIVWKAILESRLDPSEVVTWNIFPFHPFDGEKGYLSNRAPKTKEVQEGKRYIKQLMQLFPNVRIISVGNYAAKALREMGIQACHVPHPSNGGANDFRKALFEIP